MGRVLDNDDGWILSSHAGEPPLTPEMMWDQMIGPRAGTPIDTFLWSAAWRHARYGAAHAPVHILGDMLDDGGRSGSVENDDSAPSHRSVGGNEMYLYRTAVPGAEMFGDGHDADDFEGTRHGTGTLGRRYDNIRYLNERHGGPIEVCGSTRPGRHLLCTSTAAGSVGCVLCRSSPGFARARA